MTELSNSENKCPRCGLTGSGPYKRWVKNSRGKRYQWYNYFAHKVNGKIHWCYLGKAKPELDNQPVLPNGNTGLDNHDDITEKQKKIMVILTQPLSNTDGGESHG